HAALCADLRALHGAHGRRRLHLCARAAGILASGSAAAAAHFMQGFVPALVAREILIRGRHVQGRRMLAFVVVCIVLAISATYEFIEWGAALALGQGADEFLGTQGDPWDTQSDMFFAFMGSIVALVTLSRVHDRQLRRLGASNGA